MIDWTVVLSNLFAAVPPTLAALAAFYAARAASRASQGVGREVVKLEHEINHKMDELVDTTREFGLAEGEARGIAAERDRPDRK